MSDYLPRPDYASDFDFQDSSAREILTLLVDEVNQTFSAPLGGEPAIKSMHSFNNLMIPLIAYPAIKMYKVSEGDYTATGPQVITDYKLVYAIAYTQPPQAADISRYVARELRRVLKNLSLDGMFQIDWGNGKGIRTDFEDFISPENTIYRYVTLTFSLYGVDCG
jgi:hypothetical protein